MNLHEHQAKTLLRDYGLPVPQGGVAATPEEGAALAQVLGGERWTVKAQIHAGQRKQAGGIRFAESREAVSAAAGDLLGKALVTGQTGRAGLLVKEVYVERTVEVEQEIYVAALVDRRAGRVTLVASPSGGEGVEASLARDEGLLRLAPEAGLAPRPAHFEALAGDLGLSGELAAQAAKLFDGLWRAFIETDASLIELNPLAVTRTGELAVLDVKMVLDDNALFRHPKLEALRDEEEADPQEREANRFGDELRQAGRRHRPNGLGRRLVPGDHRPDQEARRASRPTSWTSGQSPAAAQIAEGMRILLRSPQVKVILVVAMGGGILRCDAIAEGVGEAFRSAERSLPIVFRGAGTAKEDRRDDAAQPGRSGCHRR